MRGGDRSATQRKQRDDDDPAKRTTFFITNISDRITGSQLWNAFQPFINVTDAWVPRRKGSNGRVFGFVRCEKIRNPKVLLPVLNEIVVAERKVVVSLAMFDRFHRKINYDDDNTNTSMPGDSKGKGVSQDDLLFKERNPDVSFMDVLQNKHHFKPGPKKSLQLDEVGAMYPRHCIGRSVVGVSRDIGKLHGIKRMVFEAGFPEAAVSYIGGLSVLITFRDRVEMENFIATDNVWKDSLVSAQAWVGQDLPFDRIAVLKIVGMPVCLRESDIFDKVGKLFGSVVWPSDFSWIGLDNSAGYSHVLTNQRARIDEEIVVQWKNKGHNVWVVEENISWIPEFEPSVVNNCDDDLEEGEIREESVQGDTDEDSVHSVGSQSEDEAEQSVAGEEDGKTSGSNGVHGNSNVALITLNEEMEGNSNGVGQTGGNSEPFVGHENFTPIGPTPLGPLIDDLGQPIATKSRKRARMYRSPSPLDDETSDFVPNVGGTLSSLQDRPDLNKAFTGEAEHDSGSDRALPSDEPDPPQDPPITGTPPNDESLGDNTGPEDVQAEAMEVNMEVDATVEVGEMVGFCLPNFHGQIANEIIAESGAVGDK